MKNILVRFGLPFILTLTMVLGANSAMAAPNPAPTTALSPYVQNVLDEADSGMEADGGALGEFLDSSLPEWARFVLVLLVRPTDTRFDITEQGQSLFDRTACLQYDVLLIQSKMKEAKDALDAALKSKKVATIMRLDRVLSFLSQRRHQLIRGALDPSYEDSAFENVSLTEDEPDEDRELCPFTSDYGPATEDAGCNPDVIDTLMQKPMEGEEFESLKKELEDERSTMESEMDVLEKKKTTLFTPQVLQQQVDASQKPKHKVRTGCVPDYVCQQDEETACTEDKDCEESGGGHCVDAFNYGYCDGTEEICDSQTQCSSLKCSNKGPLLLHALRGRFTLEKKDELQLLPRYLSLKEEEGIRRPITKAWSVLVGEFDLGIEAQTILRRFSGNQGINEGENFAIGHDPALQTDQAFGKLTRSVAGLSQLAVSKEGGLRGFVREYASFLLRSCMERPCTESLKQILKITFTDECFPFTTGEYLRDTEDSRREDKCREKAGLENK